MRLYDYGKEFDAIYHLAASCEEEDTATLEAMFKSLQCDFEEKIDKTVAVVRQLENDESFLRAESARLQKRAQSISKNTSRVKDLLLESMKRAELKKLKTQHNTVSVSSSQSVEVYDEAQLDMRFFKIERKPDKIAIKEALKSGAIVDGASFVNSEYLRVL